MGRTEGDGAPVSAGSGSHAPRSSSSRAGGGGGSSASESSDSGSDDSRSATRLSQSATLCATSTLPHQAASNAGFADSDDGSAQGCGGSPSRPRAAACGRRPDAQQSSRLLLVAAEDERGIPPRATPRSGRHISGRRGARRAAVLGHRH